VSLEGISICPKCRARLIEEEIPTHVCEADYKITTGRLYVRNVRGLWERIPLPFELWSPGEPHQIVSPTDSDQDLGSGMFVPSKKRNKFT